MKKINRHLGLLIILVFVVSGAAPIIASADTVSVNFEPSTYTLGNINGQDGWIKTGPFDVEVYGSSLPAGFGTQSLRMSDAVTSGSFGDQTFAKPLTDSVGEADSTDGSFSPGVKQAHFETQFDITSALPNSQQPGLHMSMSPDRGDGSRMSYLRFEDNAGGIDVLFDDVDQPSPCLTNGCANFQEANIATLDRSVPHTVKLTMDVVDGPSNDVVKVYIDGVLKKTGKSWEDYYRNDPESIAEQSPRIVKTVLFRESGTATPENQNNGFLIDNLSMMSGPVPSTSSTVHIFKYIDGVQATVENAGGVSFPMFTSTFNAPFTLGPTGWTGLDIAYEASTAPMPIGSSYSANENLDTSLVGSTCDGSHQYSLVGYSSGDTLSAAEQSEPSTNTPNFTDLQVDKYIIVNNHLCSPIQTLKVHILKYLDGAKADTISAGGYQFPMTATWQTSNLDGGVSSSGNYVLGNNHGGAVDQYGADTSAMNSPADYTTSEITDSSSQVVPSLDQCVPGKYVLNGYRTSSVDFATAAVQTLTATAPVFTGLTSDQYVIVDNSRCPVAGTISGMKYNDLNRNGKKNANEPGLSGWVIRLILDNDGVEDDENVVIATTTTDINGNYTFTNVAPGTYEVRETHQKGWKRMSKNPKNIVITAGSVVTDVNFGNATKRKGEKEDNDKDDNRHEQSGRYYGNHGRSDYDRDENDSGHQKDDNESRR